jgi:hypothetical protein
MSSFRGGRKSQEDDIMQTMMIKLTMSINKQCFSECVKDFNTDKLSQGEGQCLRGCAQRQSGAFAAMNDLTAQISQKSGGAGMF